AGGREKSNPRLELGQLDVFLALHRAHHVGDSAEIGRKAALGADRLPLRAGQLEQLLVSGAEDLCDRTALEVDAGGMNRGEVFRIPENRDEALGLASRHRYL